MNPKIMACAISDIIVSFDIDNNGNFLDIPVKRFKSETYQDGATYGIFEIGTQIYDNISYDVFLDRLGYVIPIIIKTKKSNIDIFNCDDCKLLKRDVIIGSDFVVLIRFTFSNQTDWETHKIQFDEKLPDINLVPSEKFLDPIYRIARGVESLKGKIDTYYDRSSSDIVMSIEDYTDMVLSSKYWNDSEPKKYYVENINDMLNDKLNDQFNKHIK